MCLPHGVFSYIVSLKVLSGTSQETLCGNAPFKPIKTCSSNKLNIGEGEVQDGR